MRGLVNKWGLTCGTMLAALLSASAPAGAGEVVLRDSIGPDNSSTNGNWPFASDDTGPGSWRMAPGTVPVTENLRLTEFRAIGAQQDIMLDFNQLDYWLRVWSSEAAAIANPNNGDLANIFFPVPSGGPTNFGVTANQNFVGVKPTWDMRFDISSANIQVLAGQTIVIGVQVSTNGSLGGGLWGWMESRELGQSDMGFFPGGWIYLNTASISFWDGRLAFKVTGETIGPVCPSGTCDAGENSCNCPQDCGSPPSTETNCTDGIDNDCDGYVDCADVDCAENVVACPNGRIPAVSQWGLVTMTLLTLTAGTILLRRRIAV